VADVALLQVVLKKDVVSNRLRVRFPVYAAGFHHSASHHSGLPPPTFRTGAYEAWKQAWLPSGCGVLWLPFCCPGFGLVGSE
jgi:hypothetical protein